MEITERQKNILCRIIEEYAETALPVGSVTMARLFHVSSATIRAEMAKLEALGLIVQPHTSAGRVPTDAGYRFYVNSNVFFDDSDVAYAASSPEVQIIERREYGKNAVDYERALAQLREWEMMNNDEHRERYERASRAMARRLHSQSEADATIKGAVDTLVELTGNMGMATIGGQLYLAGMSRLFMQPEFGDTERVRAVAKLLDNLESWLREAAPGEPLNIFIGHENPIGSNSGVSLIISKFCSPFSDRSYIGVIGPTRQNYSKVMTLVRRTGNMLEEILQEEG